MNINELIKKVHDNAVSKGFYECDMSKWQDIPKEYIELDGDEINICLEGDDFGNNYAVVKVKDIKDLLTEWVSVKDRLPEPNTRETFIVYINEGSIQTSWYSQDEDFLNPEFDYSDVIYWMPLPSIPKDI
jgi:hypothetical protein